MFRSEGDVRAYVRKNVPGIKFIEYGMGGTDGLPDCFLPGKEGKVRWWMELKVGRVRGGKLIYDVRASQVREISGLLELGHVVFIGVGLLKGREFWILDPACDGVLGGKVDISGLGGTVDGASLGKLRSFLF